MCLLTFRMQDLADMTRINNELRGKLEKAMEQLIAAQTAKEHAREKVSTQSCSDERALVTDMRWLWQCSHGCCTLQVSLHDSNLHGCVCCTTTFCWQELGTVIHN
jgi:hypothetical protein